MLSKELLDLFRKGSTHLWNTRVAQSEETLSKDASTSHMFALMYAEAQFFRAAVSEAENDCTVAFQRLDAAIALADKSNTRKPGWLSGWLGKGGSSKKTQTEVAHDLIWELSCQAVVAEANLLYAILKFRGMSYIQGVLYIRKSWKAYQDCLRIIRSLEDTNQLSNLFSVLDDVAVSVLAECEGQTSGAASGSAASEPALRAAGAPASDAAAAAATAATADLVDPAYLELALHALSIAWFGSGVFHYVVDLVPRFFKWIVEGIGFQADRQLAVKELTWSSHLDSVASPYAIIMLTTIMVFWEERKAESAELLLHLRELFPTGAVPLYMLAYLRRSQGHMADATALFEAVLETAAELPQLQLYAHAELGLCAYSDQKFDVAIPYLEKFVKESTVKGFRVFSRFLLAVCYIMKGRYDDALPVLNSLLPDVRKGFALDEYCDRLSRKMLKNSGLSKFEKAFFPAHSLYNTDRFDECLEKLAHCEGLAQCNDDWGRIYFLRGACMQKKEQLDEALALYEKVLAFDKKSIVDEVWVIPWSLVGAAECHTERHAFTNAQECLKKMAAFTGFDFENWTVSRQRRVQDRIKRYSKNPQASRNTLLARSPLAHLRPGDGKKANSSPAGMETAGTPPGASEPPSDTPSDESNNPSDME